MSDTQIHEWTVDFAQAKAAIHNLEILTHLLTQTQTDVVSRLKALFSQYNTFLGDDATESQRSSLTEQVRLFERIEQNMVTTSTKFAGKIAAQLDSARTQVNFLYQALHKVRSLKDQPRQDAIDNLTQKVPEFLSLFDAFLARLTLELRLQQAEFYKQFGDAFTHAGRPEAREETHQRWIEQYNQIMPAVEALKSVNPQPHHANAPGTTVGNTHEKHSPSLHIDKVDLLAPVKWVHSKFAKELKDVKFSDPRRGFFNKSLTPPEHEKEVVKAIFDFKGETDSDLVFKKGQLISIIDKGTEDDPNWWCGELDGKRGLFPKNYVKAVSHKDPHGDDKDAPHPEEYVPRVSLPTDDAMQPVKPTKSSHGSEKSEPQHLIDSDPVDELNSTSKELESEKTSEKSQESPAEKDLLANEESEKKHKYEEHSPPLPTHPSSSKSTSPHLLDPTDENAEDLIIKEEPTKAYATKAESVTESAAKADELS